MTQNDHDEYFKEHGKHIRDLDFYETVEEVGNGVMGNLDDNDVKWYLLKSLAKKIKEIEDKLASETPTPPSGKKDKE